jgi:hypothetical protein
MGFARRLGGGGDTSSEYGIYLAYDERVGVEVHVLACRWNETSTVAVFPFSELSAFILSSQVSIFLQAPHHHLKIPTLVVQAHKYFVTTFKAVEAHLAKVSTKEYVFVQKRQISCSSLGDKSYQEK